VKMPHLALSPQCVCLCLCVCECVCVCVYVVCVYVCLLSPHSDGLDMLKAARMAELRKNGLID
jgi:hypothetical protein